jgi:hypothetical protein
VAEALVTNFLCLFDIPRELHSEQGRDFESRLQEEVLQHLGASKTRTTSLHPQSDAMVERDKKTVEEHPPEGLGREIIPLSPSLQGIHSWYYGLDPS